MELPISSTTPFIDLCEETAELMRAADLSDRFWAKRNIRRVLRETAGLTQRQLSDLVGSDPSTIARWEAGTRTGEGGPASIYEETLEEIRTAFLTRLDFIITRHYWINPSADEPSPTEQNVREAIERVAKTEPWYWRVGNLPESEMGGPPPTHGGSN